MKKLLTLLKRYDWKNYIIYYSLVGCSLAFIIWIVLSYVNIIAHNTSGDGTYDYWKYNAIIMLFNFFKRILGK